MEFTDAVRGRRMVRSFTDEPVDAAVVDRLCDLARRAPSAGNSQATSFLVLDDPAAVGRYWDVTLPGELAVSSARSPAFLSYLAALSLLDARAT